MRSRAPDCRIYRSCYRCEVLDCRVRQSINLELPLNLASRMAMRYLNISARDAARLRQLARTREPISMPGHDVDLQTRAKVASQSRCCWLPRSRLVAYAVALTIVASLCCFYRLSENTLFGDEAAFACTTDRMQATGDWVVPFIADRPHLNATPLYNWLTLALEPWSDGSPLWYRFWSAAFGVGCVLMCFAIGAFLFRAEIGLLAGLFLAVNHGFLFDHGIRFGGMDAMLAFFVSAAALCYAWLQTRSTYSWLGWSLIGVSIGLACLSKPPVFGGCFFTLIVLHWFGAGRHQAVMSRVKGPVLAVAAVLIVAAPWYLLLWSRLGNPCLHALFIHNSVERALDPTSHNPLCCHDAIWHSSRAFRLTEVALVCAFGCWFTKYRRSQWGLLLFLGCGYLLALSAAGRAGNYIFYAFPLLAVLLAGLLLDSGPYLVKRFRPDLGRAATRVGVILAVILAGADCVKVLRVFVGPAWRHPPVGIYERIAPELAQRRCHFVLFDFPSAQRLPWWDRPLRNFEDLYYADRMPLADRIWDVEQLKTLLEDGKPTLVVLPPITEPQPQLAGLRSELRVQENPWPSYTYPVLTFHSTPCPIPFAELVRLARGSQR